MQCPYAYFHCLDAQAKGVKVHPDSWACREDGCAAWGVVDYKNTTLNKKRWDEVEFEPVYGCKLCYRQLTPYTYPYATGCADICVDDSSLNTMEDYDA